MVGVGSSSLLGRTKLMRVPAVHRALSGTVLPTAEFNASLAHQAGLPGYLFPKPSDLFCPPFGLNGL